jgi:predicted alpha-1,2-mannosidase
LVKKGKNELEGFRRSKAWATDQYIAFSMEFSLPIKDMLYVSSFSEDGTEIHNCVIEFQLGKDKSIIIKTGISQVNEAGAKQNRIAEINHWDFEKVISEAKVAWHLTLCKIAVMDAGGRMEELKIFYTAYYHCCIHPSIASDVDGQYRGRDNQIHTADGFTYYNIFSLWDTYRALHPLLTLTEPERTLDFVKTFLAQYDQGGRLPVWELYGNETNCMIGYHAVSVIANAHMNGITEFDIKKALEAMTTSAMSNDFGIETFHNRGYIPCDKDAESVSKTLEYDYDDWCISQFRFKCFLNSPNNSHYSGKGMAFSFMKNSWMHLFDPETGFMRARANGKWYSPFDPREVNVNYTEANAWQYSFAVPQNIPGLIQAHGGRKAFEKKLDELFSADSKTTGREQADITGLIGQYAHGNEPSHHIAYLYNDAGAPWKCQAIVNKIMKEMYRATPDGLAGNEDCGQMSAWYVFSALGFYPVTPGSGSYSLGTPLFPSVHFRYGLNKLEIQAQNVSIDKRFATSVTWDGSGYSPRYISLSPLHSGSNSNLSFTMASDYPPDTLVQDNPIPLNPTMPVIKPILSYRSSTFSDSVWVKAKVPVSGLSNQTSKNKFLTLLYYTINGDTPDDNHGKLMPDSLLIRESCLLKIGVDPGEIININPKPLFPFRNFLTSEEAIFTKIPGGRSIQLATQYDNQYTAGGPEGIIDFQNGGMNFRLGAWQGYWGKDFEAVIDLSKEQEVRRIIASFLEDQGSWIFLPKQVTFETSTDGVHYTPAFKRETRPLQNDRTLIEKMGGDIERINARYIRVKAINVGKLPSWHLSAGSDAWIFIDEISIE